jgi:hypothetical protein
MVSNRLAAGKHIAYKSQTTGAQLPENGLTGKPSATSKGDGSVIPWEAFYYYYLKKT